MPFPEVLVTEYMHPFEIPWLGLFFSEGYLIFYVSMTRLPKKFVWLPSEWCELWKNKIIGFFFKE